MSIVIGLTGIQGSGKGSAKQYLENTYGFEGYSCSDILREILDQQQKEQTRENMTQLANEMRNKLGGGILAKMLIQKFEPQKKYVIDSIRNPIEIDEFNKLGNFHLIHIDCNEDEVIQRMILRGKIGENNKNEIKQLLEKEKIGAYGKLGQRLNDCFVMSNYIIDNTGTLEDFYKKIDILIKKLL